MAKSRSLNPALIWGVRIGIVLGVVAAGDAAVSFFGHTLPGVVSYLEYLLFLAGVLAAGLWTTEETGRIETGAFAGVVASLPFALIINGAALVQAFVAPAAYAAAIHWQGDGGQTIQATAVAGALVGVVVLLGLGAMLALLGSWVGLHRYRSSPH